MKGKYLVVWVVISIAVFTCKKTTEPPPSSSGKIVVKMKDYFFEPDSVDINIGDTVVWFNEGSVSHTSTSGTDGNPDGIWDSGLLSSGESFERVFDSSGTFSYYCTPHWSLGMKGKVLVNP